MGRNGLQKQARVLVVDDDEGTRVSLEEMLEDDYEVVCVEDGFCALEQIEKEGFDLVLLDLVMPKMDGIETLKRIKAHDKNIDVIMVSATDRAHEAAASIKTGAYDYITKPFDQSVIISTMERALEKRSLEREVRYLRSEIAQKSELDSRIISQSSSMEAIFEMIAKITNASSNVLITGESGTGKELVARAIHMNSARAMKPFVAINCAAIPSELVESELFGFEKGAFTGASQRNIGKFEFANGGTLFLDEVSSLKLELQAKLLRFLQNREFSRVGNNRSIKVDVRLIAATNTRLDNMVRKKIFREDLYFRLNVIPIELPPLRHREGDVRLLTEHFMDRMNKRLNKRIKGVTPEAMKVLEAYPWPGNIRELQNLVERLVVLGTDNHMIEEKDLPFDLLFHEGIIEEVSEGENADRGLIRARKSFERQYILRALRKCDWNQSETARLLKIHRNTLIQKMKSLGIRHPAT